MICSSWPVPSVATQNAWVSPRVNSARAMRARQDADLGDDRPHGAGVAAVDAHAGVEDGVADDVGFQVVEHRPCAFSASSPSAVSASAICARTASTLSCRAPLSGSRYASASPARASASTRAFSACSSADGSGSGHGLLRGVLGQFDDRLDHRLEALMAEGDGAEHHVLGQLLRLGLHHQHAFRRCRRPPARAGCVFIWSAVGLRMYWPSS